MAGEKQFEPSQKKLEKAKKDGKLAKAREISMTLQISGWYYMLYLLTNYSNKSSGTYHKVMRGNEWDNPEVILEICLEWFMSISIQVLIMLVPLWVLTFLSESFQVGLTFSIKKVGIKMSNINPLEGLKKIFGQRDGMKAPLGILYYSLELLIVWAVIISITIYCSIDNMIKFLQINPELALGPLIINAIQDLVGKCTLFFIVYAIYKYQMSKLRLRKELMMDMQELRKELKEDEGDPHLKGQRKSLHQETALHGSIENVRRAKVLVVSN